MLVEGAESPSRALHPSVATQAGPSFVLPLPGEPLLPRPRPEHLLAIQARAPGQERTVGGVVSSQAESLTYLCKNCISVQTSDFYLPCESANFCKCSWCLSCKLFPQGLYIVPEPWCCAGCRDGCCPLVRMGTCNPDDSVGQEAAVAQELGVASPHPCLWHLWACR